MLSICLFCKLCRIIQFRVFPSFLLFSVHHSRSFKCVAGMEKKPPEDQPSLQEHLCDVLTLPGCCLHPDTLAFEERSVGSLAPAAVSLCSNSFVSSDSGCWSTFVTHELPCQCINAVCSKWQEISSKYLPLQPRTRFPSIVSPAGSGGSWKRVYKHSVQIEHASKSLTCLEMVCFLW